MKTNFLMAMALAIATVSSLAVNAQTQRMQPYSGKSPQEVRQVMRPEGFAMPAQTLDDKQREELKKMRTQQLKERVQTRNLLREKRAKLETLQTADKPDMKEINKVIDEIAAIQAQEMKTQAANRQKVRSLLTDEQRVLFDARGGIRENMRAGEGVRPDRREGYRPGNREGFRFGNREEIRIERQIRPGNGLPREKRPERTE